MQKLRDSWLRPKQRKLKDNSFLIHSLLDEGWNKKIMEEYTQEELNYLKTLDKIKDPYKKFMAQCFWTFLILLKKELPEKVFTKKDVLVQIIRLINLQK